LALAGGVGAAAGGSTKYQTSPGGRFCFCRQVPGIQGVGVCGTTLRACKVSSAHMP